MEIACREYGLKPGSKSVRVPRSKENGSDKDGVCLDSREAQKF